VTYITTLVRDSSHALKINRTDVTQHTHVSTRAPSAHVAEAVGTNVPRKQVFRVSGFRVYGFKSFSTESTYPVHVARATTPAPRQSSCAAFDSVSAYAYSGRTDSLRAFPRRVDRGVKMQKGNVRKLGEEDARNSDDEDVGGQDETGATRTRPPSLCDLPTFVLVQVLRHLPPADLARAQVALLGSDAADDGPGVNGDGDDDLGPSELAAWEAVVEFTAPLMVAGGDAAGAGFGGSGGGGVGGGGGGGYVRGYGRGVTRLPGESWKLCWATVCSVVAGADINTSRHGPRHRGSSRPLAAAAAAAAEALAADLSGKGALDAIASASCAPLPLPLAPRHAAHRRNAVWLLFGEKEDAADGDGGGGGGGTRKQPRRDGAWLAGAVDGYLRLLQRLTRAHLARATPRVAAAANRLAAVGMWEAAAELMLAVLPALVGRCRLTLSIPR